MIESNHLTLLIELIISVNILQGIYAIGASFDAFDDEMSATIRATYTQHGLFFKGRVSQICIKTDKDSFHWFEVFGCNDIARDLHRVDRLLRLRLELTDDAADLIRKAARLLGELSDFLGDDGVTERGWQTIDNLRYYFGPDGRMLTGWQSKS